MQNNMPDVRKNAQNLEDALKAIFDDVVIRVRVGDSDRTYQDKEAGYAYIVTTTRELTEEEKASIPASPDGLPIIPEVTFSKRQGP